METETINKYKEETGDWLIQDTDQFQKFVQKQVNAKERDELIAALKEEIAFLRERVAFLEQRKEQRQEADKKREWWEKLREEL